MHRALVMAASLAFAGASGAASAAEIKERTTYFTVRGATLDELDKDLNRRGPVLSSSGGRHPGATEVKFDGHVGYRQDGSSCKVATTGLSLNLVKTLPRWRPPKSATPETILVWKTLSEDIARHEEDHAKIARSFVVRMESAIRNLTPRRTCAVMQADVERVTGRYLADHERAQRSFDTIEGREINLRLRRALQKNVAEALGK